MEPVLITAKAILYIKNTLSVARDKSAAATAQTRLGFLKTHFGRVGSWEVAAPARKKGIG